MSYIYHATTAVSNFEVSKIYYDALFKQLGWSITFEDEGAKAYSDGQFEYWIVPAKTNEPNRYNDGVGFNHLAFRVESRALVDQFYKWLLEIDCEIEAIPRVYQNYSDKYYAVFFFDPDGTRLEVVYT